MTHPVHTERAILLNSKVGRAGPCQIESWKRIDHHRLFWPWSFCSMWILPVTASCLVLLEESWIEMGLHTTKAAAC
jgi:hypothetical protein